jgi:putative transcription factor
LRNYWGWKMGCEICGKETILFRTRIENSILNVCGECSKFGRVLNEIRDAEEIKKIKLIKEESIEVIREDYANVIKKARESKGLKQEEVARKIGEKESVVHKLEAGSAEPSIELARKLERFFNIKLIEEYKDVKAGSSKAEVLTLGDLMKRKV